MLLLLRDPRLRHARRHRRTRVLVVAERFEDARCVDDAEALSTSGHIEHHVVVANGLMLELIGAQRKTFYAFQIVNTLEVALGVTSLLSGLLL